MTLSTPMAPASPLASAAPSPSLRRQPRWMALAAVLLAGPLAGAAQAATITISDSCSLIDAITAANTDTATGGCPAGDGGDVIIIPPGRTTTLTQVNNSNELGTNGLPVITSQIRIEGNGNVIERSTAPGTPQFRLFEIASGQLNIFRVVLRGGDVDGDGGAIRLSNALLTMNNSTVTGNRATGNGGGIGPTSGQLLVNVTVSNNQALKQGGGIYAISKSGPGNTAVAENAGFYNLTVTGNKAGTGGGGLSYGELSPLQNSIVAGNSSTTGPHEIVANGPRTVPVSGGNNVFGHSGLTAAQAFQAGSIFRASDRIATSTAASAGQNVPTALGNILELDTTVSPAVPALKNNGGPTPTIALVAGSPAINPVRASTDAFTLRRDQRGWVPNGAATPSDTIRDIGAFEFEGVPPVAPSTPTALTATPGDGSLTIAFTPGAAGTAPISNYAYALGSSETFTALDPADGTSPVTITGLTNGTPVSLRLLAISEDGQSETPSDAVSGTPAAAINGACGPASGSQPTASAPLEFLCTSGTATAVTGNNNGRWNWDCQGSGGGTSTTGFACSAPYAGQSITLKASPASTTIGQEPANVSATSDSGRPASLATTTATVCTVSTPFGAAALVTAMVNGESAGTCTVKATLAGTGDVGVFRYLAASDKTVDISVAKGAQTITGFTAGKTTLPVAGMTTLAAEGGASGNAVTFSSLSSEVCFVSGSMVTALSAGTCTVAANQAGNDGYNAAAQATLDITVAKAEQLISGFTASPSRIKVGETSTLMASGGASGNAVRFSGITPSVCTVSGSTVTALAAGDCYARANQAGNDNFNAAAEAALTIVVDAAPASAGVLQVSTASLSFGGQMVNTISTVQVVTLTNIGSATISTLNLGVSGSFARTAQTCGKTLAAGASCTIDMTFAPKKRGALTGAITVSSSVAPQSVALSGTGTTPPAVLQLSTPSLAFGDQAVSSRSAAQMVTLTNTGGSPISNLSLVISAPFARTAGTCGKSLAAGASCTISVAFAPRSKGALTGSLSISSDLAPQSVSLSGRGV